MTGAIATLFLDILIVVMLALTIGYCWLLNRRIRVLQDSKSELAQLLKHFDESTQRASESIVALQGASRKIGENIQLRIEKANFTLDDLSYMIDKGTKICNQMEAGFAISRARSKAMGEPLPEDEEMVSRPINPLQDDLAAEERAETLSPARSKTAASLEAVLERVMGRKPAVAEPDIAPREPVLTARPKTPPSPARSKAEQELLDMIKAGIKG